MVAPAVRFHRSTLIPVRVAPALCKGILGRRRQFWVRAQATGDREPRCLYQGFSQYNEAVTVLEVPEDPADPQQKIFAGCRILLLDNTGNLHSVYHPTRPETGFYWDILSTLPSLIPPGPIGLLGLGAGTIPRIIEAHYPCGYGGNGSCTPHDGGRSPSFSSPSFVVHGWELDPGVVMAARMHLGMQQLESRGALVAHTGDALAPSASLPGGFSGVIVDLFAGGRLLPQLTKRSTWADIRSRLGDSPSATATATAASASSVVVPRVMVNLGHVPPAVPGLRWHEEAYTTLRAYEAMEAEFQGEVSLLRVDDNILALTGPLPGRDQWPGRLPAGLRHLADDMGPWLRDMYPLQTASVPLSLW